MQNVLRGLLILVMWLLAGPQYGLAAQPYPQRPIRMIVGLPVGGSTDLLGRLLAAKLGERLGQQVVFENRPGASGIIGTDIVAKSQPDGYTLLMAAGSFGVLSSLYPQLPFDTAKDFAPVALFASSPYVLAVHPALPVKTVAELIEFAKARPGQINLVASTPGSVQRLGGELLKRQAGIKLLYVPYKGTGALIPDLLGGRLQAAIDNVLVLVPHIKSGALRGARCDQCAALGGGAGVTHHCRIRAARFSGQRLVWGVGGGSNTSGHHRPPQSGDCRHHAAARYTRSPACARGRTIQQTAVRITQPADA